MKYNTQNIDSTLIIKFIFIIFSVVFSYVGMGALIRSLTVAHGVTSVDGQFVGRDFLYYYIANKQAFIGSIQDLYSLFIIENTYIPEGDFPRAEAWSWPYPPHSFIFLYPFTVLPYFYSLALWLIVSLAVNYYILSRLFKLRPVHILFFALNLNILFCLVMGQNAFILLALLAIGFFFLNKNAVVSALCFSVVTVKPNYAVVIPFILVFGGYYRVFIYTGLATLFWIIISSFILGWDVWLIYISNSMKVSGYTLSADSWFLTIYSTYRSLIQIDIPINIAISAHAAIALTAVYKLQKIVRKNTSPLEILLAAAITMLLLSPYSVAYDAVYVTIPCMIWLIKALFEGKEYISPLVYFMFLMQIFSFIFVSFSESLSILVILSALSILFVFDSKKYAQVT